VSAAAAAEAATAAQNSFSFPLLQELICMAFMASATGYRNWFSSDFGTLSKSRLFKKG
jgi:hypothetical protein